MDLDGYDRVIAAIYEAGSGSGTLAAMFEAAAGAVAADATGVSVYDAGDSVITHTLAWPRRSPDAPLAEQVRALNDDASARLVTGARLRQPRRFSDIVPAPRLRHTRWFLAQNAMTGLGNGMAADVVVSGIRLRLFAMRSADRPDFEAVPVDLLGRFAAHLGRAFSGGLGRLSPHAVPGDIALLLYHEERLAAAFRARREPAADLARRYGLTAAEARALAVMATGVSRQAGAAVLGVGVNSLKSHMRRIYAKTGAHRLPELLLMLRDPPGS